MAHRLLIFGLALFIASGLPVSGQEAKTVAAYDISNYGAVAAGKTKCTEAIRKAIEAADSKGGGTIYFPAGTFLTGPIHLHSHITLFLDAGSVLKFSTDFDDYLPMVPSRWEGIEITNFSPLIYAHDVEDIAIRGRGTIDGQGRVWWQAVAAVKAGKQSAPNKWQQEFRRLNPQPIISPGYKSFDLAFMRPPLIQPFNCTNVLIEGVTIINSPFWTVTPVYCENVTVHGVIIQNPDPSPNTDGIDPDSCHNVRISDCQISVGDDCITIKSGRDADGRRVGRPAENYTIVNCTMEHGHGGVVIGSEMSGNVKNITVANCVFDGTDRGIRIKAARGRGGVVENVRVSNIIMRNIRREAVMLTTFYEQSDPEPASERTPVFRNIHLNGITGNAKVAGEFTGLSEMPLQSVSLADVQLEAETGFKITDAKDISFQNVMVHVAKGPAFLADKTDGLEISSLRIGGINAQAPVIDLRDVKRAFVHGCSGARSMAGFVRVLEGNAGELTLEGNDFGPIDKAVVHGPAEK